MENNIIRYKCVLLGNENVGKSSIILRYIQDKFLRSITSTIGCSYNSHELKILNHVIKLDIWDTAGQERFRSILPMYYRNAHIILICVDLSSDRIRESFDYWYNELNQANNDEKIIVLVGTKSDIRLENNNIIIEDICDTYKVDYIETSSFDNKNIQSLFIDTCKQIYTLTYKDEAEIIANIYLEDIIDTPPSSFMSRFCPRFN